LADCPQQTQAPPSRRLQSLSGLTRKTACARLRGKRLVLIGQGRAIKMALWGRLFCVIEIGVPFGIQALNLAGAARWRFGTEVVAKRVV
jgi:uncharacterized membrane protein YccF (DUF307 family)